MSTVNETRAKLLCAVQRLEVVAESEAQKLREIRDIYTQAEREARERKRVYGWVLQDFKHGDWKHGASRLRDLKKRGFIKIIED